MKYTDFKGKIVVLTKGELGTRAGELVTQITKNRLEMQSKKVKNLRSTYQLRKQLALVKTLLNK